MDCNRRAATRRRRGGDGGYIAARPQPRPRRRAATGRRRRLHSRQTATQAQFLRAEVRTPKCKHCFGKNALVFPLATHDGILSRLLLPFSLHRASHRHPPRRLPRRHPSSSVRRNPSFFFSSCLMGKFGALSGHLEAILESFWGRLELTETRKRSNTKTG